MPDFRFLQTRFEFSARRRSRKANAKAVCPRPAARGLSLIEISMIMVFITLAMVPVVRMIGGAQSSSGEGNISRVGGMKAKEVLVANTQMDNVLSAKFDTFSCSPNTSTGGTGTNLPLNGQSVTYRPCDVPNNANVKYQWTVQNLDTNGNTMPVNNHYYQATLKVTDANNNILLTMPTHFFWNQGSYTTQQAKIGVFFALDVSGSMQWAYKDQYYGRTNTTDWTDSNVIMATGPQYNIASPYMFYRYNKNLYTGNSWGVNFTPGAVPNELNLWDNSQLDMSYGQSFAATNGADPDLSTANNEKFPFGPFDILGTGDCSTNNNATWNTDTKLIHTFIPQARGTGSPGGAYAPYRTAVKNLCRNKVDSTDWNNTNNLYMSRIEAARTASLAMLLNMESKRSITSDVELGFIPWDLSPQYNHLVPMEAATTVPGVQGLHFVNTRQHFSWINRANPQNAYDNTNPIVASGGTGIGAGLAAAHSQLMSKNYDTRILILLTDGVPSGGPNNTPATLPPYIRNSFGLNAAATQQDTLFTIGLIGADATLMHNMAIQTKDGQDYTVNDVSQLKGVFDSISYQIQKQTLLGTAKRYNINF